jgi:integrase
MRSRRSGVHRISGTFHRCYDASKPPRQKGDFTTRSGLPVEPRNLVRSFRRICDDHQLRLIKLHHLRHTTASLLKQLRVPPRDAQVILGHANVCTLQIYTHVDEEARSQALTGLNDLLSRDD